ncbi:hypothetical protein THIOM_002760 [Candidatus Thiomargarita nelsonii]|uniref:Uncharacterized protein n=1 Tax=Candidatus Thiomargarita nelsonii TaxID=1003181 RepID=A0A176S0J9_9GAMM|nr:hypothetical protein THIOM_002760 [Candidatus Thiomargarita nelsonii]
MFLYPFVNSGDIFFGDHTPYDFVDKFVTGARLFGFYFEPNMSVLSASTRLAYKFAFLFYDLADRFAVGHLWSTNVGFDIKFST